jgi:hypothetical protein
MCAKRDKSLRAKVRRDCKYVVDYHDLLPPRFRLDSGKNPWRSVRLWTYGRSGNIEVRLCADGISVNSGKKWRKYKVETFFMNAQVPNNQLQLAHEAVSDLVTLINFRRARQQHGKRRRNMARFSPKDITRVRNADIRAWLMREYGVSKWFNDMGAITIHEDGDKKLLRLSADKTSMAENMVMVQVIDSTTKEVYLLRVPPDMKTCKEAVAWTFRMDKGQYNPTKEA